MAGRVYVTGDCHGDYHRFSPRSFPQQYEMDKQDYMILCGDTACLWDDSRERKYWLEWLSQRPFTTLFVDGNHENFDMLGALPQRHWRGGLIHRITPSVLHLMRGQVFHLAGKRFFTFGGARSHDIADGILEMDDPDFKQKYRALHRAGALFRINHLSWWRQEMPSRKEYARGLRNLEKHKWEVDFIISHTGPASAAALLRQDEPGDLELYLEHIKQRCHYQAWFFGHFHENRQITPQDAVLYEQIRQII